MCASASHVCSLKNTPVLPLTTVSVAPPLLYAMTGTPAAIASIGVMPKSSFCGWINALACARSASFLVSEIRPTNLIMGPAIDSRCFPSGPSPNITRGSPSRVHARTAMSYRLYETSLPPIMKYSPGPFFSFFVMVSTGGKTT